MELPQETEDYIRESIDHTVGLHVSTDTLLHKLRALEAANLDLRHQYLSLHSKLKEKDDVIERARAEATMNAVALKKFVEENKKLAMECSNLLANSNRWERECSLYENDREALMDFANETDERAKEAEIRNHELEEENKKLVEELHFYKFREGAQLVDVSTADDLHMEQVLLDSLVTTMFGKDEFASTAHGFLEAHSELEVCQKLLKMWTSLSPLTQKVAALAAEMKNLEKAKDHLTINLRTAEDEVNVLFEENNVLNEENKRLMRICYTGSASGKGKRKSSPKMSSPVEKKVDFGDVDSQRHPLSPLQFNSPECRIHKNLKSCSMPLTMSTLRFVHFPLPKAQFLPPKTVLISLRTNFQIRPPNLQKSVLFRAQPEPTLQFQTAEEVIEQVVVEEEEEEEFSDTRVIVQNVPWTWTEVDVRPLFEKYGTVVDIELAMYNKSRNRGLVFVTMSSHEEALAALNNLESSEYEGRVLKLNWAKPKKKKPLPTPPRPKPLPVHNLFVANLPFEARANDLKDFFNAENANVVSAEVIFLDNPRRSAGYGFVSFNTKADAEAALAAFEGKEFMGRQIRVERSKRFLRQETKATIESKSAAKVN
ncbi:hypothetical protein ACJIZ3_019201 [Penstemon smallii]|uniref:RRM domain-containing protein n=1 Tax=Penstemon smallii TaxID=265156 RepID=A0ABD3T0H7_9LAMI